MNLASWGKDFFFPKVISHTTAVWKQSTSEKKKKTAWVDNIPVGGQSAAVHLAWTSSDFAKSAAAAVTAAAAAAAGGEADKPDQNTKTTKKGEEMADEEICHEQINVNWILRIENIENNAYIS